MPLAGSTRWTGARSHSPRPAAATPPMAADRDGARREARARPARRAPTSSATQWLPMTTRSGIAAVCPISVTRARVPASSADASASISRKPSACEKLVTAPEPFGGRERDRPARRPPTSATSTNSLRPSSEAIRTGTSASMVRAASGGSPARARITGAMKAWKVKIAEVGKPGSTASGLPSTTARHKRLAGLERDAVDEDAGRAELRHDARATGRPRPSRCRPTARTMSQASSAARIASSSATSSSGKAPNGTGSPPASVDRGGDDGAVAVVDPRRAERPAGRHQFVAGRQHGDARPPHHVDLGDARRPPACRSRASRCACRAAAPVSPRAMSEPA